MSKNCKPKCESDCECGECGRKEESCCDAPYRICKCNRMALNIKPNKCILQDRKYKELYCKLYDTILENNLEIALNNMYMSTLVSDPNSDYAYNTFFALVKNLFGIDPSNNPTHKRLVIIEQDGTVIMDTSKNNNTRNNWKDKVINENQNTRICVLNAQLFPDGSGCETRMSSNSNTLQKYVAVRAGRFTHSYGTFRLSVDVCGQVPPPSNP